MTDTPSSEGSTPTGDDWESEDTTPLPAQEYVKSNSLGKARYVAGYVFHGIRRHKRRTFSLLLGVMIGVALVASVFVWTDTGARVAIDDFFAESPFHYFVNQRQRPGAEDPNAIYPVKDWVDQQPETLTSFVVYGSVALINIDGNDRDNYNLQYLPFAYGNGIKDCQTLYVSDAFLDQAEQVFQYTGNFDLHTNEILVSQRVVDDALEVLGLTITIGSTLTVAVATWYNYNFNYALIGWLAPVTYYDLRVIGIYEIEPKYDAMHIAFPTYSRVNYFMQGAEVVLGWTDSIMLHEDLLRNDPSQPDDAIALNVMYPRLLVTVDPEGVYAQGIDRTADILESLFARLENSQDVFVWGRDGINRLIIYINAYKERLSMVVLVAPIILLSVLLTTFTSNLFLSGRGAEAAILRARGTSYRQLYAVFLLEFLVISIIGLVLGTFLGILIGCLLPSASGFLMFDISVFLRFLSFATISPLAWISAALVCILPATIFTVITTRTFLNAEVYETLRGTTPRQVFTTKVQALYVVLVILGVAAYVYAIFVWMPLTPLDFRLDSAFSLFALGVFLWIALCDAGARILRPGVAKLARLFRPIFGQKSTLFARSVRVRRSRILPLLVILTLTFSLTIFTAVEAQTYYKHHTEQIEYYLGGDIRIFSPRTPAPRTQELVDIPGIANATSFIEVIAKYPGPDGFEFHLFGINPEAYAKVGYWDETSIVNDDAQSVMTTLAEDHFNIILPQHLAARFNKHVGDTVNLTVYNQNIIQLHHSIPQTFEVVGEFYSAPGFGYGDPTAPGANVMNPPGFGFQETEAFAFVHEDYFLVEVPAAYAVHDYVNLTQTFIASLEPGADVHEVIDVVDDLDFAAAIYSPYTFNLDDVYPSGYLFSQGVISLLSVGFCASLAISVIALVVFVSTIVAERKVEYAIMRAIGGTRRQVTAIVIGEFSGLIFSAFLFSLALGAGFSILMINTLINLFPQPFILPFEIIWPFTLLLAVLGVVIIGMFLGAYLPARRAGAVQVSRLLRNL